MPRSPEEQRRRAEKYGRRHRVLFASHSEQTLEAEVARLVAELRASGLPADRIKRLLDDLRTHRDIRRRRAAIWAIVDALESLPPRK
jgi:hypothetical protein